MVSTAANVADVTEVAHLLHGNERHVFGDAGYVGAEKRAPKRGLTFCTACSAPRTRWRAPTLPRPAALQASCREITATARYAFGALKPILVGCLLAVDGCLRRLPAAIATACVRIQPGRTYPRNAKIKPHAFLAYKLTC